MTYIGHSMGTTQFFVGASLNPSYFKEKVNLFVGLGPVAAFAPDNSNSSIFNKLGLGWRAFEYLANKLGAYNLFNSNWMEEEAIQLFCAALDGACSAILESFADTDTDVDNLDRMNVLLKDYPAGGGYQSVVHFLQLASNPGKFTRFDLGPVKNVATYRRLQPPAIPIDQFPVPAALFVGPSDNLATVEGGDWLAQNLP